jgi:hypothetical protein
MSSTEEELVRLQQTLEPAPTKPPHSNLDDVKEAIKNLRIVESKQLADHLLTLVDAAEIAQQTDTKVAALTLQIDALQTLNASLKDSLTTLESRIAALTAKVGQDATFMEQFKQKSFSTLTLLEQYLRTHQ